MLVTSFQSRAGSTLVELLMGITVMMIVTTLVVSHVVRHQRAYSALSGAIDVRARLRDGADVLAADLRGSSPSGDSLLVASDTAIEFYSAIGTSTLCANPTPGTLILPPDSLSSGRTLSSWLETPQPGDYALVYVASPLPVAGWRRAKIESVATVATASGCPTSLGLLSIGEVITSNRSYQLTLDPATPLAADRGAPVRVIRHVRYSVYRGGDGKWYLGYRRCNPACAAVQPVSGPYRSDSALPISFRFRAANGLPLTGAGPTADVGQIDVVLRARYEPPLRLPGMTGAITQDSIVTTVALRNQR